MLKQYKVSVVTPFHNVDMDMFSKCVASVRAQTIGFENIEWIIVVHNCESGYMEKLNVIFKDDDNVILKELNNDAQTPSSPRNCGTKLVTSPYIGYLDADDGYLPNCLEVAVREAIETESQVVWFRRETEKENPSMMMPMATTLWNNTLDRIVVEHGKWDDEKMFDGLFGFATSYIYESEFLRRSNIEFSETMLFGEDFLFVVNTVAQADRICYLPQLIGYHYFVNGNSMVQNGEKSADLMIKYAEGFRDLFETMRNYGIDPQENIHIQCGFIIARFILTSPKLTVEDRKRIKKILVEDVGRMHRLPPSKTFNKQMRDDMFHMAQDVILNPENPGALILRFLTDGIHELFSILEKNFETDIGKRYNFPKLNTFAAYQYRFPLTNDDFYMPLIRLQTQVGEKNILTTDSIKIYFATDQGALVPCTSAMILKYAECLANMLKGKKNLLIARSLPILRKTSDDAEIDTMQSSVVKNYFFSFFYQGGVQQAWLSSTVMTYFKQDNKDDDYFDIMQDALAVKDLDQIVGLTTNELLRAFTTLENQWRLMLDGIADINRREEVRLVLENGFDTPVAKKLWPKLEKIVAYGSGEMRESFRALKRYTGELPHNHGYYILEETILGKAVTDDSELFECLKEFDFYELQSVSNAKIYTWTQVELGNPYFVIVTNRSGLYRYETGHIIVPREISLESIKFTVY